MIRSMCGLVVFVGALALLADEPKADLSKKPQWQRMLTGEDEKTAEKLAKRLVELEATDDYEGAIQSAEELVRLRVEVQGADHHEVKTSGQIVVRLRKVAALGVVERRKWRQVALRLREANKLNEDVKYAAALVIEKEILEMRRKVLGEDHQDTASSYNNVAFNLDAQGKASEAEPLYRKALEINRKVLGEHHPNTSATYNNVARSLQDQGNVREAEPLYRKALEICRKVLGEDHKDTAISYNNVGFNLQAQGKAREAEPLFRKALDIDRKVVGEDHQDTATSYNNLAVSLDAQGKASEAEQLYRKALQVSLKVLGEYLPDTAQSYNNLACNLIDQGKAAEAEPLLHKALDTCRKVLGEEHPDTARSYRNLASNLEAQGKATEAEPLCRKALEICRKVLGEDHPETASSYNTVGSNLQVQGKAAEAEQPLRKALEICSKVLGEDHPDTAFCYNNISANLDAQGKTTEAEPPLRKALEICSKVLGEDHPETSLIYHNLASILDDQGKATEAEQLIRKALNIRRKVLGDDHPKTEQSYNLASTLVINSESDRTVSNFTNWIRSFESSRLAATSGVNRGNLANFNPRRLLACLLASNNPQAAWQQLELSLARGFFDQQNRTSRLSTEEQRQQTEARQIAGSLQPRILNLVSRSNRSVAEAQELEDLLKQRRIHEETNMALAVANSERAVEHSERIQAALPTDAAILYWIDVAVNRRRVQEHWACVVRNQGEPKFVRLPGTGENQTWTTSDSQVPGQLQLALANSASASEVEPLAKKLHTQRIDSVLPHLAGVRTLNVVSTYAMAGIPIEALTQDFRINYVPSGSYLARLGQQPKVAGQQLLALGDPQYPSASPANRVASRISTEETLAKLSRGGEWAELPGTAAELASLQSLFAQSTILTRNNANPQKLAELAKANKLKDYRYLHFATHGEANSKMAFQSSLILHGDDKSVARLTAREILDTWKLNAELVTLSACETAIGKDGGGDGLLGFAQAFLTAGARSVCLSLWKVDDAATALLMDRFYRNLLGKRDGLTKPMGKADALHEAKQWLRNLSAEEATARYATLSKGVARGKNAKPLELVLPKAPYAKPAESKKPFDHPRFWAAFILIGDPN